MKLILDKKEVEEQSWKKIEWQKEIVYGRSMRLLKII